MCKQQRFWKLKTFNMSSFSIYMFCTHCLCSHICIYIYILYIYIVYIYICIHIYIYIYTYIYQFLFNYYISVCLINHKAPLVWNKYLFVIHHYLYLSKNSLLSKVFRKGYVWICFMEIVLSNVLSVAAGRLHDICSYSKSRANLSNLCGNRLCKSIYKYK